MKRTCQSCLYVVIKSIFLTVSCGFKKKKKGKAFMGGSVILPLWSLRKDIFLPMGEN